MNNENKECCPKFNPEKWDQKTHNWNNKPFVRTSMPTIFHMPLPFMINKKITKIYQLAEEAKMIETDHADVLIMFRDPSAFRSEIYLSVAGQVPGADNTAISGTFMSKVFSGPYAAVPKFIKEMDKYLTAQGKKAKDYYIHYAYCPKCAKKYGDNYMIIFAQV
jgi:hypothetical protein